MDGHTVREDGEDQIKTVIVKPGMAPGTVLRYKGEGNEQYKKAPTDLVVTLVDDTNTANLSEAARQTKRRGNDLIYTCKISL